MVGARQSSTFVGFGLKVGHSFPRLVIAQRRWMIGIRTALVNTRFLVGNRGLHNSLEDALEKDRRRRAESFITAVSRERDARYRRSGATACLQEPNVKETAGGLRDFHTALWLIHARHGYKRLDEARAHNLVSESEARKALRSYDFLWRVRNSAPADEKPKRCRWICKRFWPVNTDTNPEFTSSVPRS